MSGFYQAQYQAFMETLEAGTITAHLVTSGYTPNYGTHSLLSDVPSAARQASAPLSSVEVVDGWLRAAPTNFENAMGDPVSMIVLEHDGALIGVVDDFGSGPGQTELALNGSTVTANWSTNPGICGLEDE